MEILRLGMYLVTGQAKARGNLQSGGNILAMIPEALSPSPGGPFVESKVQVEDSSRTTSELSGCVLRVCPGRRRRFPGTAEREY